MSVFIRFVLSSIIFYFILVENLGETKPIGGTTTSESDDDSIKNIDDAVSTGEDYGILNKKDDDMGEKVQSDSMTKMSAVDPEPDNGLVILEILPKPSTLKSDFETVTENKLEATISTTTTMAPSILNIEEVTKEKLKTELIYPTTSIPTTILTETSILPKPSNLFPDLLNKFEKIYEDLKEEKQILSTNGDTPMEISENYEPEPIPEPPTKLTGDDMDLYQNAFNIFLGKTNNIPHSRIKTPYEEYDEGYHGKCRHNRVAPLPLPSPYYVLMLHVPLPMFHPMTYEGMPGNPIILQQPIQIQVPS